MMRRLSYRLSNSVVWEPKKFSIIRKKLVIGKMKMLVIDVRSSLVKNLKLEINLTGPKLLADFYKIGF